MGYLVIKDATPEQEQKIDECQKDFSQEMTEICMKMIAKYGASISIAATYRACAGLQMGIEQAIRGYKDKPDTSEMN